MLYDRGNQKNTYGIGITIAALSLLVSNYSLAGELFLELGVGYEVHESNDGNPRSVVRLIYETKTDKFFLPDSVEYSHHSSIFRGKPFNEKDEEVTDQVSAVWRFKLF